MEAGRRFPPTTHTGGGYGPPGSESPPQDPKIHHHPFPSPCGSVGGWVCGACSLEGLQAIAGCSRNTCFRPRSASAGARKTHWYSRNTHFQTRSATFGTGPPPAGARKTCWGWASKDPLGLKKYVHSAQERPHCGSGAWIRHTGARKGPLSLEYDPTGVRKRPAGVQ